MTSAGMGAKRSTEFGDLFITVFGIEDDGE